MTIFMRDNRNQTWRYLQAREHDGKQAAWQNIRGEFQTASKDVYKTGLEFFHADSFDQIKADIGARGLIHGTLAVWLDHGVITPNGDFYGVHAGQHQSFEDNLKLIAEQLPESLAKQLAAKDIYGTWLHISKNNPPQDIPADATTQQRATLEKIGYLNDGQIASSGKFYQDAFKGGNSAFAALSDKCFDILDAGDRYKREHRARAYVHTAIGIENGFNAPC